jgi:hypothetical protein
LGLELTVPIAATAIRPSWAALPEAVRDRLEQLLGVPGEGRRQPRQRDGVDCLLALLTGYFTVAARQPAVPTSPYLRSHQGWYARAAGGWLMARRGWT